ncbi:MAG TPA: hypothetical protein VKR56_09860 [Candidatus Cybelea sp.]|nr:hypothetical protein [Candidatus Cybelea sp.]
MKVLDIGRHALGNGLAVAILTGCAGIVPLTSQPQAIGSGFVGEICKSNHGVSVKPCSVVLTDGHPKAKVVTTGPEGGTFTFTDKKCTLKDIAEVEGRNDNYLIGAGAVSGQCVATFIDKEKSGKTIGTALLSITNFTRNHCPPTCRR